MKQGHEPPIFTCHFLGWNPNLWSQDKTYKGYLEQVVTGTSSVEEELAKFDSKHPYDKLTGKQCPHGVDPTCKEVGVHFTDLRLRLYMT